MCTPKTYCSWVSEGTSHERGVIVRCRVAGNCRALERELGVRPLLSEGAAAGVRAGVTCKERGLCGGMRLEASAVCLELL